MEPRRVCRAMNPDPATRLPDYAGGSLVNLMSSLARGLGAESAHPPARLLPPEEVAAARHVVLLVVDGLGHGFLSARSGALRERLRGRLTSVFPSTTAAAIPVFLTGATPLEHGLTGWHVYFREIGAVAAPLPFRLRAGGHSLREAGLTPGGLFGLEPVFDRLPLPCHVVSPHAIVNSEFNTALSGRALRHGYESVEEMFGIIEAILAGAPDRCYVYAYWPQLDTLAHRHGAGSAEVAAGFRALDTAFARFLRALRGSPSLVVVTADHGFLDATHTIDLDDHPRLRESLVLPLCGEPRAAFAYVRAGREAAFEADVKGSLGNQLMLLPSRVVLQAGWFGPGTPHPQLENRIGDYVLLPRGGAIVRDWLAGEERYVHVGVHGGLSAAEMEVPLVVAFTG